MQRLVRDHGLPEYDADLLTQSRQLSEYFEQTAALAGNAKAASNWIMGEVLRTLKERGLGVESIGLTPAALAGLIKVVDAGTISSTVAKDVFAKMWGTERTADEIVTTEGLAQIGDKDALMTLVDEVLATSADAIEQYKKGRNNAFGFLVGQVMKASKGKADPKVVTELLKKALG